MLDHDDLWLVDEEDVPFDEPSDVLDSIPEIRRLIDTELHDGDELGLRSVLERPRLLSRSWWRTASLDGHRAKRRSEVPRAA
jgi:hypothetical protein